MLIECLNFVKLGMRNNPIQDQHEIHIIYQVKDNARIKRTV